MKEVTFKDDMMKNTNDKLWQLIADEMGQSISASDQIILEEMIKDPVNRSVYDILTKEHQADNTRQGSEYSDILFDSIRTKINRRNSRLKTLKNISIAASFLVCILGGYLLSHMTQTDRSQLITYNCTIGGHSSLILPDNTKVSLNSGTELTYPDRFTGKTREVKVNGEAFFEVAKDTKKPFIIEADKLTIKVLGTSFNLKAYSTDTTSVLSLVSGSVEYKIKGSDNSYTLSKNEQIIFSKNTGKVVVKRFDPEYHIAWKDGNLAFAKTSLGELCKMLERRFGYTIIIENQQLNNLVLTGIFVNNENIFQILDAIKLNTNLTYHFDNEAIVLE